MADENTVNMLLSLLPGGALHEPSRGHGKSGIGFVLHYLYRRGGCVSPGELGRAMDVTGPRVTAVLKDMEDRGLILRSTAETDRRSIAVTLTDAGRSAVERRDCEMRERLRKLADKIGPEDAEALVRILKAAKDLD